MSAALSGLAAFHAEWRAPVEDRARLVFEAKPRDGSPELHTAIADRFVSSLGYQPIGPHWEMLDDGADASVPRSAIAAFTDALGGSMTNSKDIWLGDARAAQCGRAFVECFTPGWRTILTNRIDLGWHPISPAEIEWAFVGFDNQKIALFMVTD